MHRRAAASTPTTSKVAASRERRAARLRNNNLINGGAGSIGVPYNGHANKRDDTDVRKKLLIAAGTLTVGILGGLWIAALYHVTATSDEPLANQSLDGKLLLNPTMNTLRRTRRKGSNAKKSYDGSSNVKDYSNIYTKEALQQNPYLGWQPTIPAPDASFSWRSCFKAKPTEDATHQPLGCRENPSTFGAAPQVDENWIPDVTMVRSMLMHGKDINGNEFPPPLDKELCENIDVQGGKGGDSNKELLQKAMIRPTGPLNSTTVTIHPSNHYDANGSLDSVTVPAPRLMCLVYTMADAHSNRIQGMRETWAGGCDGFLAFSTESDPRLPTISLPHDGPEAYTNMWQKVRSIWKFVGENYLDDHDWFFIGGDDLFVMPHNLKTYLASLTAKDGTDPTTKEYFVGRRFNAGGKNYFNSGGAGYALSQATLRKFLANIDDAVHCSARKQTSTEDVQIANCLSYLGISFTDTRDANGRERFHPFAPGTHLYWKHDESDWYEQYNKEWGILLGKDCCAPDSVSFHYVKKASMVRHMHALITSCDGEDS